MTKTLSEIKLTDDEFNFAHFFTSLNSGFKDIQMDGVKVIHFLICVLLVPSPIFHLKPLRTISR